MQKHANFPCQNSKVLSFSGGFIHPTYYSASGAIFTSLSPPGEMRHWTYLAHLVEQLMWFDKEPRTQQESKYIGPLKAKGGQNTLAKPGSRDKIF